MMGGERREAEALQEAGDEEQGDAEGQAGGQRRKDSVAAKPDAPALQSMDARGGRTAGRTGPPTTSERASAPSQKAGAR
jgi:hypothetical protein